MLVAWMFNFILVAMLNHFYFSCHVQVTVSSIVCGLETVSMAVGFQVHLSNSTMDSLANNKTAPPLVASILAPFGLVLSSTTVIKQPDM